MPYGKSEKSIGRQISKSKIFSSVQSLSHVQLCDPIDCSTPGFPVHHQLPELTQTHVHWVGVAIQPSYSLLPPSPLALNLSQHQGLFQWVSSSHQVAKVLEFQLQHQFSSVQLLSHVRFFATPWTAGFPVHHQLPELAQTHVHWVGVASQSINIYKEVYTSSFFFNSIL